MSGDSEVFFRRRKLEKIVGGVKGCARVEGGVGVVTPRGGVSVQGRAREKTI